MLEIEELRSQLSHISASKINELNHSFLIYEAKLPIKNEEIIKNYQDAAKPNTDEAYAAAFKFLAGSLSQDSQLHDIIAFALNKPIIELSGMTVLSNETKLSELLTIYRAEIEVGEFWELAWFGILQAYFEIPALNNTAEQIRLFLESNFQKIYESSDHKPFWMEAFNKNLHLLSKNPCLTYAKEWLNGRDDRVNQIKSDVQIPENSWFWNELVISCIQETINLSDIAFKEAMPKLLNFIKQHPVYLDFGLLKTLERYQICSDNTLNKELKDLSVELWKSPRLRNTGGSKWLQVEDSTWKMVLGWVNEANLRLFFQLLKQRGVADKNRLDFWLKYINQVSWTKLALGDDTSEYFKNNRELSKIFENEKDSFSSLEGKRDLDAFIMEIGNYLIVEFSTEGGCYIYKRGENTFDINASKLNSSTSKGGLKERRKITGCADITHSPRWQERASLKLMKLSIYPDANKPIAAGLYNYINENLFNGQQHEISHFVAPSRAEFEQACKDAHRLSLEYGIKTEDLKHKNGGYWVYLDREIGPVATKLKQLGFIYKTGRGWWIE